MTLSATTQVFTCNAQDIRGLKELRQIVSLWLKDQRITATVTNYLRRPLSPPNVHLSAGTAPPGAEPLPKWRVYSLK